MSKKRKQYPSQYRRQIVDLVRSGRSPEAVAREFEPSAATVQNWVRQADIDEGRRSDRTTTRERDELGRLKRGNKRLRLERDATPRFASRCARAGRPAAGPTAGPASTPTSGRGASVWRPSGSPASSTLLLVREDIDLAGPPLHDHRRPDPERQFQPVPEIPATGPTLLGLTRSLLFATLTVGKSPTGDFGVKIVSPADPSKGVRRARHYEVRHEAQLQSL